MRIHHFNRLRVLIPCLTILAASASSAFGATFTVGGKLSGLKKGESVTLATGKFSDKLTADGKYSFGSLASGASYDVTVTKQPAGQLCSVAKGSGKIGKADVTDVNVTCVDVYTLGGKLSGLKKGESVTLENGKAVLKLSKDGSYAFATAQISGTPYDVSVKIEPAGQTCSVANPSGKIAKADVIDIDVACVDVFSVGGALSGLASGSVTLENNRKNPLVLAKNGSFRFSVLQPVGTPYDVSVTKQPAGQTCTVTHGTGKVPAENVITVVVTCIPTIVPTYSVGGSVQFVSSGGSVTLLLNGGNSFLVTSASAATVGFTAGPKLASGASYAITVSTATPTGENCTVTNGSGKIAAANVTNVSVSCSPPAPVTYSVGGTVGGLTSSGGSVVLANGSDTATVTYPGTTFTFATKLVSGATYAVTVKTPPTGETCSITGGSNGNGSGTVGSANVSVTVTCTTTAPTKYSIGGTVGGLTSSGGSVVLANGSDTATVTYPGTTFTFATKLVSGATYAVTVKTPPTGETCSITGGSNGNGSGTVGSANVSVTVTCTTTAPTKYSIGGTVGGLTSSGGSVVLANGSDTATVTYPGTTFTFATKLVSGATYAVTVKTPPTGETCSITGGSNGNGSGTVASANVSVTVTCSPSTTGGGGNPFWIPFSALAITNYTIGGTVSGLNDSTSVTLSNLTDSDSVTVTANGPFTFPISQADGAFYLVVVGTPPTGENCTVTNGSGSVDSINVKSIIVFCKASTAAPSRIAAAGVQPKDEAGSILGGFLNPAAARATRAHASPMTDPPVGGQSGIFLIASKNLESNPAPTPTWITTTPATVIAVVPQITVTSNAISGYAPDLIAYYQIQADGTTQFYGLNISNISATPTPTPIGAAIPATKQVCHVTPIFTDLTDPTSGVAIIGVATGAQGICGASPTLSYEILKYTTPSSTAPTPIGIASDPIGTLYTDNLLSGILVMDSTNNALDFYTDATFKTVSQVITDVCYATSAGEATLQEGTAFGNTIEYLDITAQVISTPATPCSTKTGATTLYRIDSTSGGTAKQIFANQVGPIVSDDNNVYFTYTNSTNTQGTIYEAPISGSSDPAELYTTSLTFDPTSEEQSLGLIGSNNSKLVFALATLPLTSMGVPEENLTSSNVYTVPVGSLTTTTSTLASNLNGNVGGFLAPSSGTSRSSDVLFLNIENVSLNLMNNTETFAFSTTAGPLTGTLPAATANSYYNAFGLAGEFGAASGDVNNAVFQIQNITETDGGFGGGNIFQVNVGTLAGTEMTTTGGGDYQIPAGYFGLLELPYSQSVAVGDFLPISNKPSDATPDFGTAGDLIKNFILQVGLPDSNVFAY
jgi:hypothetical protein